MSFCLNVTIQFNSEKNNKAIKLIAALTPCIFEAVVTMSLLSFTLKSPEISPALTAKIPIKKRMKTAFAAIPFLVLLCYAVVNI